VTVFLGSVGAAWSAAEQAKIDRLLPIVVETEQIPNRLNFPLNSRARISDGSWIRCFEVGRKGFRSQIKALSCTRTIEWDEGQQLTQYCSFGCDLRCRTIAVSVGFPTPAGLSALLL
jgi:hypothetical protein